MNWIFPCNTKYFDIHRAFEDLTYLNWDIQNQKIEIGDYVYIYVTDQEKAIRYKCVVTDLSDFKTIDDSAYGGSETGYRANQATLRFLVTYTEPGIELSDMRKLGINPRFSMQSIIHMPEQLEEYIQQIEEESFAEDKPVLEEAEAEEEEQSEFNLEGLRGAEREAVIKVRVNQSAFRRELLKKYSHCFLCAVSNPGLLIASHIKPWYESTPEEKTNLNNGLLLCPNHDRLFDKGFISFDKNGRILIAEELSDIDRTFMNVNPNTTIEMNDEMNDFMEYHRNTIFKQ